MTAGTDVRVRLPDGRTYEGPIVDLRGTDPAAFRDSRAASPLPAPTALRRAILAGRPAPSDAPVVDAPAPGPVHAHATVLHSATSLARRPALAAVAVARGVDTARDDELAAARRSLRASEAGTVGAAELREARRRAAEAGSETARLRERVATVRGRVNALREAEVDDAADARSGAGSAADGVGNPAGGEEALAAAESSLSEATRRLSEAATERVAAAQRLSLLEERARAARDERDARLRLEDRIGNLERAVRDARVAAVEDDFLDARRLLATRTAGATRPEAPASADLLDALAVVRIAPVRAPIVAASEVVDALGGAESAFDLLDAPLVIR